MDTHILTLAQTFVKFTREGWQLPAWLHILADQWGVDISRVRGHAPYYVCEFELPQPWEQTQ